MSRVRSWLAAPLGARLLGVALVVAGVALLVLGVFAFGSSDSSGSGAAPSPSPSTPPATTAPATTPPTATEAPTSPSPAPTTAPTSPPRKTVSPGSTAPAPVRAPVTVLNNSTIRGLGEQVAAEVRARGWTVVAVGNFAGVIPVTTVYYTPGDPAEQAAAEQLQSELPQIERVLPRYEGLPPTPGGLVLVVTRDWS